MSSHSHSKTRDREGVPQRPKTPDNYVPTPYHQIAPAPASMLEKLTNEHQKGEAACVHNMSREQLRSSGRLMPPPQSPSPTAYSNRSNTSFQSLAKGVVKGLALGKTVFEKTRPAIETAIKKGKEAGQRSKETEKAKNAINKKGGLTHSSSTSSRESLYYGRELPRLNIPDARKAAEEALGSACSMETTKSPSWRIVELSPTSRELRQQVNEDYSQDIKAEFLNMISARRRARKSKWGRQVARVCWARHGWDDGLPNPYDASEIAYLKTITAALQEQKDTAQDLAKRNPARYPGLRPVRNPGCSNKDYWQHRSY
ncbi:hypothetical protein F5X99DRAFT_385345 [Biscogniauxia marginata]|nr:hypothetical protein F5X99DRAFT_385345 [Biscogniauxia marginata]